MKKIEKVNVKLKDGTIRSGYLLDIHGEYENKYVDVPMVIIPKEKKQDCPVILFCKYPRNNSKYNLVENTKFPFINIYDKRSAMNFVQLYGRAQSNEKD